MFVDFVEKDVEYHWYPLKINYCRRNEYSSDEVDDDWKKHFCFFSWSDNAKAIFSEVDHVFVYRLMIELWSEDRATRTDRRNFDNNYVGKRRSYSIKIRSDYLMLLLYGRRIMNINFRRRLFLLGNTRSTTT